MMKMRSNSPGALVGLLALVILLAGCAGSENPLTPAPALDPTPTIAQPTATASPTPAPSETPAVDTQTSTASPTTAAPVLLLQGKFEGIGRDHSGSGTATIYERPGSSFVLSFENFAVCCGPDLHVFLAQKTAATSNSEFGNYQELGPLKDLTGEQEYYFPAETDLTQIKSVVIFCKPYQVVIANAPLQ